MAAKKNTVPSIPSIPSMLKKPPESIIGDSGIAAAATTLVYKLQYGKD